MSGRTGVIFEFYSFRERSSPELTLRAREESADSDFIPCSAIGAEAFWERSVGWAARAVTFAGVGNNERLLNSYKGV